MSGLKEYAPEKHKWCSVQNEWGHTESKEGDLDKHKGVAGIGWGSVYSTSVDHGDIAGKGELLGKWSSPTCMVRNHLAVEERKT